MTMRKYKETQAFDKLESLSAGMRDGLIVRLRARTPALSMSIVA